VGGVAIGLVLAWLAERALRTLDDQPLAILFTVIMGYAAFAIAESVEASGVLAAVSVGLYLGWRSHELFDADLRLNAQAFWRVLVFALNAVLFILLGMQFPEVLRAVGDELSVGSLIAYGLLVSGIVIGVRMAWQFLPSALARVIPAAAIVDPGDNWRERVLIGWSGLRGAVSLAAALALPLELDSGEAFASRDLIIYLAVAVILVTLVGQGLTLPKLVGRLGLSASAPWAPDEAVARLAAAQAALDRIDEIEATEPGVSETVVDRIRDLYRARFARCIASLEGEGGEIPIENPLTGYPRLREQLIDRERRTLIQMRNEGRLKTDVLRRIERDLDLDEARIRS